MDQPDLLPYRLFVVGVVVEPIRHVVYLDMLLQLLTAPPALSRLIFPPLFLVLTVESFLRDKVSMFRL